MAERDERTGTLSGLTDAEAKEFHGIFVGSFILFTLIAIGAHVLVWMWRPWFPSTKGYSALESGVSVAQAAVSALFG
jgi:light-harvesting complex 1 beta chain